MMENKRPGPARSESAFGSRSDESVLSYLKSLAADCL